MRFLKRLFLVLLALLMAAMVAIYLTPLDVYVPEVEQVLSKQLREPITVQHLRLAAVPFPHLELQGVRLGGDERITAQSVDVELDFSGLLAGKKVCWRIVIRDGVAAYAQVRKLIVWFNSAPAVVRRVAVRELQLSRMGLLTPEMILGPVEGKLEFAQDGKLERAWFAMDEQKVTAILSPQADRHFDVKMHARDWAVPQFPQLVLDELLVDGVLGEKDFTAQNFAVALHGMHATGSGKVEFSDGWRIQSMLNEVDAPLDQVMAALGNPLALTGALHAKGQLNSHGKVLRELRDNLHFTGDVQGSHVTLRIAQDFQHPLAFDEIEAHVAVQPGRLAVNALEAKLYGGEFSGSASVTRKSSMLKADVSVSEIAMQPVVEALTNEMLFSGSMDGAAKLSMRLDAIERFTENMHLDGHFHLRNGVLSKLDLVQAASNPGKVPEKIGTTRFDDLSGLLNIDANGYHFRKIKMTSGSFNADGKIDISHSLQLSGMLDADVKGTIGLVSMPLVISGTLSNPVVRPSGTALAGAAVGTAILGPGLGTAVGIKIGGFLNKLFGKNGEKNDKKNNTNQRALEMPAKN